MWIDSHSHLNDAAFDDDREEVIQAALDGGLGGIIVVGYDLESSKRGVEIAAQHQKVWAAVGVHPHDAQTWNENTAEELRRLLNQPQVVALGEIGLDYHYNYSEPSEQEKAFREQLSIAKEFNKPVIIHNREAHGDTLNILKENQENLTGVLHCFSGSKETAEECLKLGLYLSFAGPLTYAKAEKLREVAVAMPLDKILVETDAPYLSPVPYRGSRNEPLRVGLVGEKLAQIKGLSSEAVRQATSANTQKLFGIK